MRAEAQEIQLAEKVACLTIPKASVFDLKPDQGSADVMIDIGGSGNRSFPQAGNNDNSSKL